MNTCGSFDQSLLNTTLSIHAGTGVPGTNANELAANGDWASGDSTAACPSNVDAALAWQVRTGDELLIRISRVTQFSNGAFTLNLAFEADPLVSSISDSGAGSLRQTITEVPAGSVITFDPSLDGQVITLGGTQLLLDKDLAIDASALPNGITISGDVTGDGPTADDSRIFQIASGITATFRGLTITGGKASQGGGIYNGAGTLNLIDSTLSNNTAQYGGAL